MPYRTQAMTLPISPGEFLQAFKRCAPPSGWRTGIAVANSGGPDSTCLLFLIHRLLHDFSNRNKGLPSSVASITVDHDLQDASRDMAKQSFKMANSLGVKHVAETIQWGVKPFPPKPEGDAPFEHIARTARYHVLLQGMKKLGVDYLATAHHADDQVETSLMRLARGSSELGAGGMRRLRRFGMGLRVGPEELGYIGYEGMSKWLMRPLLDFSKDRILATCEENSLVYVTDKTNFQPSLTLRNAVRQLLLEKSVSGDKEPAVLNDDSLPSLIRDQLLTIHNTLRAHSSLRYETSVDQEHLRTTVQALSSRSEDIEDEATSQLRRRALPSPTSTFLLSSHRLSAIDDQSVKTAMILRIMRYASYFEWGSLRAEGSRSLPSLQRIATKLWHHKPLEIQPFVGGGGVFWIPVGFTDGKIQTSAQIMQSGKIPQRIAWLVKRQPPLAESKDISLTTSSPLSKNITHELREILGGTGRTADDEALEILWDCRFLVSIVPKLIPPDIVKLIMQGQGKVTIHHVTEWYWPAVIWRDNLGNSTILAQFDDGALVLESETPWATFIFVRTLDVV